MLRSDKYGFDEESIPMMFNQPEFYISAPVMHPDTNEFYILIIKDNIWDEFGVRKTDMIKTRVSIMSPKYIDLDNLPNYKFTQEELFYFYNFIKKNWEIVINQIRWNYQDAPGFSFDYSIQCPDYTLLS